MLSITSLLIFIVAFFVIQISRPLSQWAKSFLIASLVWGILVVLIIEFLSIFHSIGFWQILFVWFACLMFGLTVLIRKNVGKKWLISNNLPVLTGFELFCIGFIALAILSVGVIGSISPPNNWDSMTYHLSRVAHWQQNQSLAHYPTSILRQLHQSPWAEMALLHLQILNIGDRLANLVQWFSLLGSVLGVTLLAKQFGTRTRGQIITAVVVVTIPMGILQSSSTQNDLVVSFWLVCFIYFAFELQAKGKYKNAMLVGSSLGLAVLTKGTAYIIALPFLIWIGITQFRLGRKGFGIILVIAITALALNTGHFIRNYRLFGTPIGTNTPEIGYQYTNEVFNLKSISSNIFRNIGIHLSTPIPGLNAHIENGIYHLHDLIGMAPNDSKTTWPGTEFHIIPLSLHEDLAGNPLHLGLLIFSLAIFVINAPKKNSTKIYIFCVFGAFLLFNLIFKWQPWHSRLHLPFFILWSPVIGHMISRIRAPWLAMIIVPTLMIAALPYILKNQSRPLLGPQSVVAISRSRAYFANRPQLFEPYLGSSHYLRNSPCRDIGLWMGVDDWEYPFWVLLDNLSGQRFRMEHINVTNLSHLQYSDAHFSEFMPCAVIVMGDHPSDQIQIGERNYFMGWFSAPVSVFVEK